MSETSLCFRPSMQIESHQTYYTYIEDDKIASYVVNNRFILSPEIFNEHFVDVTIIRNEQLNNLLEKQLNNLLQ